VEEGIEAFGIRKREKKRGSFGKKEGKRSENGGNSPKVFHRTQDRRIQTILKLKCSK